MSYSDGQLLQARVKVPEHVVRRAFADETVVLNLQSGQYHGLNATAAAMVDALEGGEPPVAVAARISAAAGQPAERVQADLVALLRCLAERGLVELDGDDPA